MKLIRLKCDDSQCEHWPDDDGWLCDYDDAETMISELKTQLAELQIENERLREDQMRLDWFLEHTSIDEIDGVDVHILAATISDQNGRSEPTGDDYLLAYRQCIDQAMGSDTPNVSCETPSVSEGG